MFTYTVTTPDGKSYFLDAHGYIVGDHKPQEFQFLVFFIRMGDELIEIARFKDWSSVRREFEPE